jgi:hypothetical protein
MDAHGSQDRPAATTAPVGRAGDHRPQHDTRRAVRTVTTATALTGGPLLLLAVLLTLPAASVPGRPVPLAAGRLRPPISLVGEHKEVHRDP